MVKFYLNGIETQIETNASFLSQVGSFDSGSCKLAINDVASSILPHTPFKIVDTDTSETWNFTVVNDKVSLVRNRQGEIKYLHDLTFASSQSDLTTHLVRNSKFTQPMNKSVKTRVSAFGYLPQTYNNDGTLSSWNNEAKIMQTYKGNDGTDTQDYYYHKKFSIKPREKVSHIVIETDCFMNYAQTYNFTSPFMQYTNWQSNWLKGTISYVKLVLHRYDNNVETNTKNIPVTTTNRIIISDSLFFANSTKDTTYEFTIDTTDAPTFEAPTELSNMSVSGNGKTYHLNTVVKLDFRITLGTYFYTLWDVLNYLQKQVQKKGDPIFTMPNKSTNEKGILLNSIIAPEFTFTSLDLFSCVAEVMTYIDAFPTLSDTNELGFDYLNDNAKTSISIVESDEVKQLGEKYFTNRIVTDYQNARQELPIFYPARNTFANVGSKVFGVPKPNDYVLKTDKPIDSINKVYIDVTGIKFAYQYHVFDYPEYTDITIVYQNLTISNNVLDISECVFEQSEYALLSMSQLNSYSGNNHVFPTQFNTFYYGQGGKEIYVGAITDIDGVGELTEIFKQVIGWSALFYFGGFYSGATHTTIEGGIPITWNQAHITSVSGLSSMTVQDLKYFVEYFGVFDGRNTVEREENKLDGETYVAQSSASPNINRMGTNMQYLIARMGNEQKSITLDITSYGSRAKKGSLWVDDDGNKYFINAVKTTFLATGEVMVEGEFTKDFNLLSQFTTIDQQKRFYEISDGLTSKGIELYTEFLYFSLKDNRSLGESISASADCIEKIATGKLKKSDIETADISFLSSKENETDLSNVDLGEVNSIATPIEKVNIPLHVYGLGNMICFEVSFEHQMAALDHFGVDRVDLGGGSYQDTYVNHSTIYCASSGFADNITLGIYGLKTTVGKVTMNDNFPLTEDSDISSNYTELISITDFPYFKRENETFGFNYEIALLPYNKQEIYFGRKLIDENAIIPSNIKNNYSNVLLYVGTSDDEKYSIGDQKALGTLTDNPPTITISNGEIEIEVDNVSTIQNVKSWCLADSLGNILIAVNQEIAELVNGDVLHLYYFTHQTRI